jgi:glycerol uptake facilitator-like aquaporin
VSSRIWKPQGLRDVEFWRDVFVEYLGTMLFVFFAIGAIVFTDFKFSGAVGLLAIAFAFGLS